MKQVFLDIEGTLIESLDCPIALVDNIAKIKDIISEFNPDRISTFSFGLWTEADFILWNHISMVLITNFGLNIETQGFKLEEFKLCCLRDLIGKAKEHEIWDFTALLNKERVFEWFIRKNFRHGHFILIDDLVPNKKITVGDLTIEFIDGKIEVK